MFSGGGLARLSIPLTSALTKRFRSTLSRETPSSTAAAISAVDICWEQWQTWGPFPTICVPAQVVLLKKGSRPIYLSESSLCYQGTSYWTVGRVFCHVSLSVDRFLTFFRTTELLNPSNLGVIVQSIHLVYNNKRSLVSVWEGVACQLLIIRVETLGLDT